MCSSRYNRIGNALDKALARFHQLGESRTADDRARADIAQLLQRWFVLGREARQPEAARP